MTRREGNHGGDLAWRGASGMGDNHFSFFKGLPRCRGTKGVYCERANWSMVYGAIDFLREREDSDQPLCLFLPLGYPHPPYCVEEPWYSLTDRAVVPPRHVYETWDDKPALLAGIRDGQGLTGWTEERWRKLRATYYGMCARVDHQLGLLINALRETGLYDDTALFVFSDHGDFTGDYGLVGEDPKHVPRCLEPRALRGEASERRVKRRAYASRWWNWWTLPATVYDLAGIDCGYWHFGRSLAGVLVNPDADHRDAVLLRRAAGSKARRKASERESVSSASSPRPLLPEGEPSGA